MQPSVGAEYRGKAARLHCGDERRMVAPGLVRVRVGEGDDRIVECGSRAEVAGDPGSAARSSMGSGKHPSAQLTIQSHPFG
jgi:hypothetical protein